MEKVKKDEIVAKIKQTLELVREAKVIGLKKYNEADIGRAKREFLKKVNQAKELLKDISQILMNEENTEYIYGLWSCVCDIRIKLVKLEERFLEKNCDVV